MTIDSSDKMLLEEQTQTVPKSFGTAKWPANKLYQYPTKIRMNQYE